ncbi:helix-turn-helix domain-containing protein [Blastococcus tunisiensis]|uniref:AraC-type DNA-binding protein n=1 Tax=Blastococcus tunisiensis TaxID=1798228 RepID=A0A1I2BFG2_9ACTN|nr:AraC family transcriptional regulator [Blastococcus sp. DSM 46838]SFE54697.1 AraC-type DNA-binding protein [Blastococcus sp. DSM 46838]
MGLQAVSWNPAAVPAADRVDAWREAISASHLPWALQPGESGGPAPAESLTDYRLGDLTLVDCRCGPCAGHRGRAEHARTDSDSVGVLFVRAGEELVEVDDERLVVRPGSALVWRSSESVRFVVPGPLHKWTLLLPAARVPALARPGARLLGGGGVRLLTALLGTTLESAGSLEGGLDAPVADAAVDLLTAALQREAVPGDASTWARVTAYVRTHLRDPELSPAAMAAAGFVSLRSLYAVFAARDETPSRYVRRLRLTAARRELERAGTRVTVAEVAHGCGFRDQATFGRAFRAEYGCTPDEVRRGLRTVT